MTAELRDHDIDDVRRHPQQGVQTMSRTTIPGRHRTSTMLPIFRLRLRNGASIGPVLLKRLWSLAAASDQVSVSRDVGRPGHASVHQTYIVSAPGTPWDVATVETTLRRLLQEQLSAAHVELTRLA